MSSPQAFGKITSGMATVTVFDVDEDVTKCSSMSQRKPEKILGIDYVWFGSKAHFNKRAGPIFFFYFRELQIFFVSDIAS